MHGTLATQEPYIFLDMVWLNRGLKLILNHKDDPHKSPMFGDVELNTAELLGAGKQLVDRGILKQSLAGRLWGVENNKTLQDTLVDFLITLGVALPLPRLGDALVRPGQRRGSDDDPRDLLILMRLAPEPSGMALTEIEETRRHLSGPRLKAQWVFHDDGAPHGVPERVLAHCHRMGRMSAVARWRYGAIIEHETPEGGIRLILTYTPGDEDNAGVLAAETAGVSPEDYASLGFVASGVLQMLHGFPGASWTGSVMCAQHHEETMYFLANPRDFQVCPVSDAMSDSSRTSSSVVTL